MSSANMLFAGIVIAGLIVVIILQTIFHRITVKDMREESKDLRDRLMSRDFHDFSVGKTIQAAKPVIQRDAEELEELLGATPEDRELADRLPVT